MSNHILVEQWLEYLLDKGRKDVTIENYRHKLTKCLNILEDAGRGSDPRKIIPADLVLLNRRLGMCENSRHDYIKVLGYWVEWFTGKDPMEECGILWNRTQPDRVFINTDEFARLMEVADERDRVILLLGGAMGLRRDEIRRARYEDIRGGRLTIHGKGHGPDGKVAVMKIPEIVMSAIEEWTRIRNGNGMEDLSGGCIVVSYQKAGMKQMADSSLSHHIRQLGERAGVRVTTHSLRRLFATSLYRNRVDPVDIKTLMRHANINTTINCYIDPDRTRLDGILDGMGMVLNISEPVDVTGTTRRANRNGV